MWLTFGEAATDSCWQWGARRPWQIEYCFNEVQDQLDSLDWPLYCVWELIRCCVWGAAGQKEAGGGDSLWLACTVCASGPFWSQRLSHYLQLPRMNRVSRFSESTCVWGGIMSWWVGMMGEPPGIRGDGVTFHVDARFCNVSVFYRRARSALFP